MSEIGFPDATNTGVPAGVPLTLHNGDLFINTPGVVVSGLDIRGTVYINAPNVTLQNCKVASSGYNVVSIKSGVTGTVIQDCELNGNEQAGNGISGTGTFLRNDIYAVGNGINLEGSNNLVQENYIHDLEVNSSDPHYDGIQVMGGNSNTTIRHNTIASRDTSCIFVTDFFGPSDNVVIDNNLLTGADMPLRAGGAVTNLEIINNVIEEGHWGYVDVNNPEPDLVWSNNTELGTGKVIAQTGTLSENSGIAITGFSTDSGTVGDGITNDDTLTLTGTAAPDSTVKVYDGTTLLGETTANGSDAWSFATPTLANGSHTFTATAITGNTISPPSSPRSVTVDTVAPNAPTIVSISSDTGAVGNGTTADNTLTLTGTAAANSAVKVYDEGALLGAVTANGSGAWSFATASLADGIHNFSATATDVAGNTSVASSILAITVNSADSQPTPNTGTGGNDMLSGTNGADILRGYAGDDTYTVNNLADQVVELPNEGIDKVESTISYTLPGNLENLQLLGNANVNGAGNDLSNIISGNGGSNKIEGKAGNDTLFGGNANDQLFGGTGADVFVYKTVSESLPGYGNRDLIWDFQAGIDEIDLSAIDAKEGGRRNQSFTFKGEGTFGSDSAQPGLVKFHYDSAANRTLVEGTVNTSAGIDFQISLVGQHTLNAYDFIL